MIDNHRVHLERHGMRFLSGFCGDWRASVGASHLTSSIHSFTAHGGMNMSLEKFFNRDTAVERFKKEARFPYLESDRWQ